MSLSQETLKVLVFNMVMLRRSSGGAEPATARKSVDMDSSSEFLSLHPPQRKSARLKRGLDDSFSSADSTPGNVSDQFDTLNSILVYSAMLAIGLAARYVSCKFVWTPSADSKFMKVTIA